MQVLPSMELLKNTKFAFACLSQGGSRFGLECRSLLLGFDEMLTNRFVYAYSLPPEVTPLRTLISFSLGYTRT